MRTVASKIDNDLHEKLIQRCNAQGCSTSEFVRGLIEGEVSLNASQVVLTEASNGDRNPIPKVRLRFDSKGNIIRQEDIWPEKEAEVVRAKRLWVIDEFGNRREIPQG